MKVRVIEVINNDFTGRLQRLLGETFGESKNIDFQVNYFIGENEEKDRGLYFLLTNNKFGHIYQKYVEMKDYETPLDVEDIFFNSIMNDLFLAGMTFLNVETIRNTKKEKGPLLSDIIFLN